ncbi:MAG: 30S ribosome-binding factor RbfA [Proteobacteria bacterium]|nr:30S ribosome-binding factor RbfA [Pseudomonadota bacterium]MCH8058479.1 30S ribosome-binding factor RbfA [Pseudomonadota bacterium]MCH8227204.1 30S ribosome-binding factor RbfA [Pseudomonadota bacterium]
MPREFNRSDRVAGSLRRELAKLIQMELRDPEVGFISLSDVEVSRDLAHAKVFVTVFESEKAGSSLKALKRAAGFLRSRLGQEMRIRSVPELHFHHDASVETGQRMDSLIEAAVAADHEHHQYDENDTGD